LAGAERVTTASTKAHLEKLKKQERRRLSMPRNGHIEDKTEAYYVGLMNSVGYRKKDLARPVIGVVNSWNDVNPGHKPFRELAQVVKEGV
jgi:dihydroxyacid dehydratase/phosphogluconate dehydratase